LTPVKLSPSQVDDDARRYEAGASLAALADELKCASVTVRTAWRAAGVTLRRPGGDHRRQALPGTARVSAILPGYGIEPPT
jgi:hypothetical protein